VGLHHDQGRRSRWPVVGAVRGDTRVSAGRSRLGLWHLPVEERVAAIARRDRTFPNRAGAKVGRGVVRKGAKAELEVVRLWLRFGWSWARRQVGSGSIRRFGAGDVPELAGDVSGLRPW
jgi:hypothetical protein